MIRYPVTSAEIEAAVDAESPGWRARAQQRTEGFRAAGEYRESSPIWGEVKPVYMRLQKNKCVYCETKLEGGLLGNIQHDLEHFRPKRGVEEWPPPNSPHFPYPFPTGGGSPDGYHLLAYHLGNYSAACKTCNSPLKANHFPVAGARIAGRDHPHEYAAEGAFLVYPLGTGDEDPEELITFEGVDASPRISEAVDAARWRRARIIIDFFALNREGLQEDRARVILAVWLAFCGLREGQADCADDLDLFTSPGMPHTACARCFRRLCESDPVKAERLARQARESLRAISR